MGVLTETADVVCVRSFSMNTLVTFSRVLPFSAGREDGSTIMQSNSLQIMFSCISITGASLSEPHT